MDTKNIFWLAISHAAVMYISLLYIFIRITNFSLLHSIQRRGKNNIVSLAEWGSKGRKEAKATNQFSLLVYVFFILVGWKLLKNSFRNNNDHKNEETKTF